MESVKNEILRRLVSSSDVFSHRTLLFTIQGESVAYSTEYKMHSVSGDFNWYTTWQYSDKVNPYWLEQASIYIHPARARLYFPAYLNTRIPPRNREQPQLSEILARFGMTEYDKFTLVSRSHGVSPIKAGVVHEVEARHCDIAEIHAIAEIEERYLQTLSTRLSTETQLAPGIHWKLPELENED